MTPTTRRYPRSLSEAFGPYHHLAPLQTEYMPMHKHDKILIVITLVLLIVCGVVYVA
jgi:hypothetical protein